jgi:hypothetical protein
MKCRIERCGSAAHSIQCGLRRTPCHAPLRPHRQVLRRRIEKAGHEFDTEKLSKMQSLMTDQTMTFLVNDQRQLYERQLIRKDMPHIAQDAVFGEFAAHTYCVDKTDRELAKRPRDARRNARSTAVAVSNLIRGKTGDGNVSQEDPAAEDLPQSVAEKLKLKLKMKVFTQEFVDTALAMSYFPVSKICKMAANDFLRNPSLMIAVYLEWSTAAQMLADSGQLSTGASNGVLELAETLALAPAGCLDYLNAAYIKHFEQTEYAGFSVRALRDPNF